MVSNMQGADVDNNEVRENLLRDALRKPSSKRSYEEILLIKSYISKVEFVSSRNSTNRTEQVDDLCRSVSFEVIEPSKFLYRKGDYGDKVYIVYSGQITVLDSTLSAPKDTSIGDDHAPRATPGHYARRASLSIARRLSAEVGSVNQRRGNVQLIYPGYALGIDGIAENIPRSLCAVNEADSDAEVIAIEKTSFMKYLRDAYDPNKEPALAADGGDKLSKEHIVRILKKPRLSRTSTEIEALSAYVSKHLYVT
jgi:CRP-like cAMP-binding protein